MASPNPPVITQIGNPDPNAAPVNITDLIQLLNTLITSEIQGSYIPYIIDSITPGSDQQDFAWIQTDSVGRPIATKIYYNGNWRRIYNGMLGEVRMYNGDPTIDFDTNGLGLVGQTYDGWHICNGKDGTPDMSDQIVVGAHMNDADGHVGYNSGWQSFIDGVSDLKNGGAPSTLVLPKHLPPFDPVAGSAKVNLHGAEYKADADHTPDALPLIDVHYANLITHDVTIGFYGSGPNDAPPVPQVPLPTLPPFTVRAFITFVGYA